MSLFVESVRPDTDLPDASVRRSVLLVDDDRVFRERLARALRGRGLVVETSGSPEKALERLHSGQRFDYAVIDLRMPGISGLELLSAAKSINAEMHIVILTGYGSIASAVDAMVLGAWGYVAKPTDADEPSTFSRVRIGRQRNQSSQPSAIPRHWHAPSGSTFNGCWPIVTEQIARRAPSRHHTSEPPAQAKEARSAEIGSVRTRLKRSPRHRRAALAHWPGSFANRCSVERRERNRPIRPVSISGVRRPFAWTKNGRMLCPVRRQVPGEHRWSAKRYGPGSLSIEEARQLFSTPAGAVRGV